MSTTEVTQDKPPAEINVGDFSNLVAGMSRLLIGLASIPPFKEANLGLAEWVALSVLAEKEGSVSNKQLGRNLGVTGQRANQIGSSLSKAGLISIVQSAEDNRKNEIAITDAGRAQFDSINSQLKPLLGTALKNKERSLLSASKQIRLLMRIVQSSDPDKQQKRKDKKAKAAGEGGAEA
jgi:DNA-binding MarR family transcriptional regulator